MINFGEIWLIVTQIKLNVYFVEWWKNMTSYDTDHLKSESYFRRR